MIPASSSRGARLVGVSPGWTTNSTLVSSSEAGSVRAEPRSSRTRSDTKPSWSAEGLSHAHGTTTARRSGRATVAMTTSTSGRDDHQEQEEAQDPADAAAAVAVPLVPALVPGPAAVPARALVGVGPSDRGLGLRVDGLPRTLTAPDAHRASWRGVQLVLEDDGGGLPIDPGAIGVALGP